MNPRAPLALLVSVLLGACHSGSPSSPASTNNAPLAMDSSTVTNPGVVVAGVLTATDPDGDELIFELASNPASGAVTLSGIGNRDFQYLPAVGFVGADSFTFTANDGELSSAPSIVTINVNTRPVSADLSITTSELVPVRGVAGGSDAEGDPLTYAVVAAPAKGVLTVFDASSGEFEYTPDPAQDGLDRFTFVASDSFQTSPAAFIDVEIFKWTGTRQFGSVEAESATIGGLYRTTDGGLVYGGFTRGQLTPTPAIGGGWLRKSDRRGNEVWTVQFGDDTEDRARIISPDPGSGGTIVLLQRPAVHLASVLRFDEAGNETQSSTIDFGGVPLSGAGHWGAVDGSGDVYVLSWRNDLQSSVITKVNGSNGMTLWQRQLLGTLTDPIAPFDQGWGIIRLSTVDFDADGNVVVSGWYIPDASAPPRPCEQCALVVVYDPQGALLSSRELNDFSRACQHLAEANVSRINVAPDQSLWAIGIGDSTIANTAFLQISRYSPDGSQLLWTHCDDTRMVEGRMTAPILFSANGDGLAYGSFLSSDGLDPRPLTFSNIVVWRLTSDGQPVFRTVLSSSRLDGTRAFMEPGSMVEDSQGLIYLVGATDGQLVPGSLVGSLDIFQMRLDAGGAPH